MESVLDTVDVDDIVTDASVLFTILTALLEAVVAHVAVVQEDPADVDAVALAVSVGNVILQGSQKSSRAPSFSKLWKKGGAPSVRPSSDCLVALVG